MNEEKQQKHMESNINELPKEVLDKIEVILERNCGSSHVMDKRYRNLYGHRNNLLRAMQECYSLSQSTIQELYGVLEKCFKQLEFISEQYSDEWTDYNAEQTEKHLDEAKQALQKHKVK